MKEKVEGKEPRATSTSGNIVDQSQGEDTLHCLAGRLLLLWVFGCKEWIILIFELQAPKNEKEIFNFREPQGTLEVLCVAEDCRVV